MLMDFIYDLYDLCFTFVILGGYDGDKPLKSVERFDPRENK